MKRAFAFGVLWGIRAVLAVLLLACFMTLVDTVGILSVYPLVIVITVTGAVALDNAYAWAKRTINEKGGGK